MSRFFAYQGVQFRAETVSKLPAKESERYLFLDFAHFYDLL